MASAASAGGPSPATIGHRKLGVHLIKQHSLEAIRPNAASLACTIPGKSLELPCEAVVLVTERLPQDALYLELKDALAEGKLTSMRVIGDAEAPSIIAHAVYAGCLAAREFDERSAESTPFRIERVRL
jgi:dimethylamine/trimethylamine dehydrogenase